MKTVQELLLEISDKELTETYFAEYPIDFKMISNNDLTLGEIREKSRIHFLEFVQNMRQVKTESGDFVFFACKVHSEGYTDIQTKMCELDDIRTQSSPQIYSCIFADFSSILGTFVAETELTKKNLATVLSQILYEMSFFGYDQESMEKEREKLEEAAKDPGEGISFKDIRKKLGWAEPGEDERELSLEITKAEHNLNQFYFQREVKEVQKIIGEN